MGIDRRASFALLATLCLAGCGGGGGGSSANTGPNPGQSKETLSLSGGLISGVLAYDDATDTYSVQSVGANEPGNLEIETSGENPIRVKIDSGSSSVGFSTQDGDTLTRSNGIGAYQSADGNSLAIVIDPTSNTLAHQSFGSWLSGLNSAQGTFGVGSFGNETPVGQVPTSGIATYNGASTGIEVTGGETNLTVSSVAIDTDFSSFTFQSNGTTRINSTTLIETPAPSLDLNGSGTVSANSLTGSVSSPSVSGSVSGSFFGPNAREAGGVFATSGTGTNYIGTFGVSR